MPRARASISTLSVLGLGQPRPAPHGCPVPPPPCTAGRPLRPLWLPQGPLIVQRHLALFFVTLCSHHGHV